MPPKIAELTARVITSLNEPAIGDTIASVGGYAVPVIELDVYFCLCTFLEFITVVPVSIRTINRRCDEFFSLMNSIVCFVVV